MFRLIIFVLLGAPLVVGCTCITPKVRNAKKHADIVFRGRITEFKETGKGYQNVVFTIDRVWKGEVARVFEMPALREGSVCIGFWPSYLETGKYLLVYAYKVENSTEYYTDICSRTAPAETSKDFARLGKGYQPSSQ